MNGGERGLRGSRYTYRLERHLYEGGLGARGSSLLTHTTPYPIPWQRSRIALYNRLCAQSIVTRHRGMGYKIPPWGKGLNCFLLHLGQLRDKKSLDLHENPLKVSKYDGVYTVGTVHNRPF